MALEDPVLFGLADPYPAYHALRAAAPVRWSDRHGAWIVTGHAEATCLLGDDRVRHWGVAAAEHAGAAADPFAQALARWLRLLDPRAHSRLRTVAGAALAPARLAALAVPAAALADRLLDEAEGAGRLELVRGYTDPLALDVVGRVFGVPDAERAAFADAARALVGVPLAQAGATASGGMPALVRRLVRARRDAPTPDLLGALAAAQTHDGVDDDEVVAFATLFLFAGHENVLNFLGNAVHGLTHHPAAWARLRALASSAPDVPAAELPVDELLRHDSPVQFMAVRTTATLPLGAQVLPAGAPVLVCLGAANRDPARFPNPDQLDLGRRAAGHLAFGHGPLACLGAALARLQARIALAALARRLPALRLLAPVTWRQSPPVLRGPERLWLAMA